MKEEREMEKIEKEKPDIAKKEKDLKMTLAETTVQKWGNSLAVRIPSHVAEKIDIKQGSEMEFALNSLNELVFVPKRKKPTLEELLAKCNPEDRHDEIDFGGRMGRELF